MRGRAPFRVHRMLHLSAVSPVAFPQMKIVVVTAGWINLVHRDRIVSLAEGDLAILPAGALVGGEPQSPVETVTLYIEPDFLQQQFSWVRLSNPMEAALLAASQGDGQILSLRPSTTEHHALSTQAHRLADCDSSIESAGFRLLGASLRFLDSLTGVTTPTAFGLPRKEVRMIVTAFRSDLARPWSMASLSRQVNLSTSQLTRAFNATYGASPMRVLTRLRIEKFAELLQATNRSVQDCAAIVGWGDADHASKMMKRMYGVTPTEFRESTYSSCL